MTQDLEDKRLDRLLDYTKFHIGIYLSIGGGIVALLGSDKADWVFAYLRSQTQLLGWSLVFMVVAGLCGGIVASSTTIYKSFDEFWLSKQGPMNFKIMPGQYWAMLEHIAFWISIIIFSVAVIFGNGSTAKCAIQPAKGAASTPNSTIASADCTPIQPTKLP